MTKTRAVVADMDGTLIDSMHLVRRGLYETVRRYLTEQLGKPRPVPEFDDYAQHVHEVVGKSTREMLEQTVRAMYRNVPEQLEGIDYDALNALLDRVQDDLAPEYVRPYAGAEELFAWIGENHLGLAIFTGATPYQLVRNLGTAFERLECADVFRRDDLDDDGKLEALADGFARAYKIRGLKYVTPRDIARLKPHPEGAMLALGRLGVEPGEALMIGDHMADIRSGAGAGIATLIGVAAPDESPDELMTAGAQTVVSDLKSIPDWLRQAGLV